MKRLLLILTLATNAHAQAAPDHRWMLVTHIRSYDKFKATVYLDSKTALIYSKEDNPYVTFWYRTLPKANGYSLVHFAISRDSKQCRILAIVVYDASNHITEHHMVEDNPWVDIVPDSITEALYNRFF
jgi:hypothetical protein